MIRKDFGKYSHSILPLSVVKCSNKKYCAEKL